MPPKSAKAKSLAKPGAFFVLKFSIFKFELLLSLLNFEKNNNFPPSRPVKKLKSDKTIFGISEKISIVFVFELLSFFKYISKNLSAGTLSFEYSSYGEKVITNCGASEGYGRNPEYLRYSAAHSTIILQNTNISEIKEGNPHIKFPQDVTFESNSHIGHIIYEGSHNGYQSRYNRIIKRKLKISEIENKIYGEDSIIAPKNTKNKIIYHIRFHLAEGLVFNFTNNKKNIILRSNSKNMWLFKSDVELEVEDSIIVDNNITIPTKQIVIKGITNTNKQIRNWSIEKV